MLKKLLFIIVIFIVSCNNGEKTNEYQIYFNSQNSLIKIDRIIDSKVTNVLTFPVKNFCPASKDVEVGNVDIKRENAGTMLNYKCIVENGKYEVPVRVDITVNNRILTVNVNESFPLTLEDKKKYIESKVLLHNNEKIIGLGENFDSILNNGKKRFMQLQFDSNSESGLNEVHLPVPFYISSYGYGLFVQKYSDGVFDVGKSDKELISFSFYGNNLKFYIFLDDDPKKIINDYIAITGKPRIPPKWAFGVMWWRDEYYSENEIMEDIDSFRTLDIPLSTVWIDAPWETGHNTYDYDLSQFPDPEGMIKRMKEKGVNTFNWITEHINSPDIDPATKPYFDYGKEHNFFVTDSKGEPLLLPWGRGKGAIIDFTYNEAAEWWRGLISKPLLLGGLGFKLDYGEDVMPLVGLDGESQDHVFMYKFHNGKNEAEMHGFYKYLYHKNAREACEKLHGDNCFLISRTGTFGDQTNVNAVWPGDLDNDFSESTEMGAEGDDGTKEGNVGGLKAAVMAGINLGLVGFPYFGSDIGGYRGDSPSKDVMARWLEYGAFTAIFQVGGSGDRRPWIVYDNELTEIYRKYAKLYVSLFPYIYTWSQKAYAEGVPLQRTLWLDFPDDNNVWNYPYEYLFGDQFLVRPIVDKTDKTDLYLPKGIWMDYWSGEVTEGPKLIKDYDAPLNKIPLFVRRGAVVTLSEIPDTFVDTKGLKTLSNAENDVEVKIYPYGNFKTKYYNGLSFLFNISKDSAYLEIFVPDKINVEKVTVYLKNFKNFKSLYLVSGKGSEYDVVNGNLEIFPKKGYYKTIINFK